METSSNPTFRELRERWGTLGEQGHRVLHLLGEACRDYNATRNRARRDPDSKSVDLPPTSIKTSDTRNIFGRRIPRVARKIFFFLLIGLCGAPAQQMPTGSSSQSHQEAAPKPQTEEERRHQPEPEAPDAKSAAKQSKRILWIIPNYRTVGADTQLPPLTFKNKIWLATQDSFDYSSFALAGAVAGIGQSRNSSPEFHQGAAAYGRYYWHSFADQAVGNYFTEAIVPAATREDPRYYTLGHGRFVHRTWYSLTRLLITRTDSGSSTFNFSEIAGNGAAAAISNLYYPAQERTWTKTGQKWVTQVGIDGVFNVFKEFWPDIDRVVFRNHY
jgi:hypothetical protein